MVEYMAPTGTASPGAFVGNLFKSHSPMATPHSAKTACARMIDASSPFSANAVARLNAVSSRPSAARRLPSRHARDSSRMSVSPLVCGVARGGSSTSWTGAWGGVVVGDAFSSLVGGYGRLAILEAARTCSFSGLPVSNPRLGLLVCRYASSTPRFLRNIDRSARTS